MICLILDFFLAIAHLDLLGWINDYFRLNITWIFFDGLFLELVILEGEVGEVELTSRLAEFGGLAAFYLVSLKA